MKLNTLLLLLCIPVWMQAQPGVGESTPNISLKDMKGNLQTLSSLKGKVVLVDFWASWCVPCRKSNNELISIYDQYRSKGFEILGVNLDEKPADWKKAVAKDKINWTQVNEAGGWEAPVALAWKVEKLPSAYLIDKSGKVIAIDPNKKELLELLKKML